METYAHGRSLPTKELEKERGGMPGREGERTGSGGASSPSLWLHLTHVVAHQVHSRRTKAESGPRSSRWTTTMERWMSEFLGPKDRAISSRVRNRDEGRCVVSPGI